MEVFTTINAREKFAEMVNKVSYGDKRIIISRRGKELCAVISMNDLRKFIMLEN